MSRMLIMQMERFGRLSPEEKLALIGVGMRQRELPAAADLSFEGSADSTAVLLAGIACRYVVMPGGRRQILAYVLPGEFCDRQAGDQLFEDHRIGALSDIKIMRCNRGEIEQLSGRFSRIARALELARAVEQATLRQWLLSLGTRDALDRTAHLLCELFTRFRALGLARGGECEIALRQTDLADALGLTPVHVSRTLSKLRQRNLATFSHRRFRVLDWRALRDLCAFRADYLFAGTCAAYEDLHDEVESTSAALDPMAQVTRTPALSEQHRKRAEPAPAGGEVKARLSSTLNAGASSPA